MTSEVAKSIMIIEMKKIPYLISRVLILSNTANKGEIMASPNKIKSDVITEPFISADRIIRNCSAK
jgi:hypothetical protein